MAAEDDGSATVVGDGDETSVGVGVGDGDLRVTKASVSVM